jgi:hypothetical protein
MIDQIYNWLNMVPDTPMTLNDFWGRLHWMVLICILIIFWIQNKKHNQLINRIDHIAEVIGICHGNNKEHRNRENEINMEFSKKLANDFAKVIRDDIWRISQTTSEKLDRLEIYLDRCDFHLAGLRGIKQTPIDSSN